MVTTRSRSNSSAALPNSRASPNTKKHRGRPSKTSPNEDLQAANVSIVNVEIGVDESVEVAINAVDVEKNDQHNDKRSKKVDRTQLKRQNKEQKQLLRRKMTGSGVTIQNPSVVCETEPINRKIVFNDVDSDEIHDDNGRDDPIVKPTMEDYEIQNDDDDNDLVEEVMGSSQAKDKIRLEAEQIRVAQRAVVNQKRKRKPSKNQVTSENESGFDDDFFQKLEREQLQSKKRKKSKACNLEEKTKQRPMHTMFVEHKNGMSDDHLVELPHNIQAVVLSNDDHTTNEPVSDIVQLYSRCGYIDPNIVSSSAINEKATKKRYNAKAVTSVATWTRSDKMKHILSVPSRVRRQGKAAINFASKSKR